MEQLNRLQNQNALLIANATDGSVKQIFLDTDKAWVDVNEKIETVHDGADFLWLSEKRWLAARLFDFARRRESDAAGLRGRTT